MIILVFWLVLLGGGLAAAIIFSVIFVLDFSIVSSRIIFLSTMLRFVQTCSSVSEAHC